MGTDKALIEIGDRPLARRVADEIGRVCGSVSLVGDPARYGNLGRPVIPDRFPGRGPLAGIEAALGKTTAEWNLVVACDMPSLDVSILEELFEAGGDCTVPSYSDGRVEPLCAVFRKRCHAAILEALESGVRKVTEALGRLESKGLCLEYVRVNKADSFANLNTPEDLERFRHG